MQCKNNSQYTYTGKEMSPLGLGFCADAESVGTQMVGRDNKSWIVGVKNNDKIWIRAPEKPVLVKEETVLESDSEAEVEPKPEVAEDAKPEPKEEKSDSETDAEPKPEPEKPKRKYTKKAKAVEQEFNIKNNELFDKPESELDVEPKPMAEKPKRKYTKKPKAVESEAVEKPEGGEVTKPKRKYTKKTKAIVESDEPVMEKKAAAKRGPSGYNLFIGKKISELRLEQTGLKTTEYMKMAQDIWREMSKEEQTAFRVCLDDLEVQRGDLLVAHVARHAETLEHAPGERARTDRARCTVVLVVAVAGALAVEVVALHAARETLAAADRGDVDLLAGSEGVRADLLADLETVDGLEPQLDDATARLHVGGGEVTRLRLRELLSLLASVGDLQCVVPVTVVGLHLYDSCRLDAQHGDGDDALVLPPHLCHADLFADDRFLCHGVSRFASSRKCSAGCGANGALDLGCAVWFRLGRPSRTSIVMSRRSILLSGPGPESHGTVTLSALSCTRYRPSGRVRGGFDPLCRLPGGPTGRQSG